MENNYEIIDDSIKTETGMEVSKNSKMFLKQLSAWTKFLAILAFIVAAILVVMGIVFSNSKYFLFRQDNNTSLVFLFFMIVVAVFISLPAYFLLMFSIKTESALRNQNSMLLEASIEALKTHFMIIGIYTLLYIGFNIIVLIIGGSIQELFR